VFEASVFFEASAFRDNKVMSLAQRCRWFLCWFGLPAFGAPVHGIGNFYQVDEQVYRGAQPTDEGFRYLAGNGVKVVIDLREHDRRSLAEERVVTAAGMRYINVPMTGLAAPTDAEISTIMQLLEDHTIGTVFVHCKRGADRTGVVIAAYRIQHDHWANTKALSEAMSRGMSWYQFPRQSYIRAYRPQTVVAGDVGENFVIAASAASSDAIRSGAVPGAPETR
jgi:tyrosine-protein phosphatase SIW14